MLYEKYSVLMSVYKQENPNYLTESLRSMLEQSVLPDEIVLVKDGPLTGELEKVIEKFSNKDIFKVIALESNLGLGRALNIGLQECRNNLVARMDTDDISEKNRCEKQLKLFEKNNNLSVVGTAVVEFIGEIDNIVAYKEVKTTHNEITNRSKYRNPINHPSVMFKKSDVISVGSYRHWNLNEDYFLWLRMIHKGFMFQNINEPLVKMRITNETYLRRGGWDYFITQKRLFDYMHRQGTINFIEYGYNNLIRLIMRVLIPNRVRKILYLKILRKKFSLPSKQSTK